MTIIFMPGAQKSGSSTLAQYLFNTGHFVVTPKETHFLAKKDNVYKFKDLYADKEKYYLDASQSYLYAHGVIDEIINIPHKKKFIFILRNPSDRCYSSYMHTKKRGAETRNFRTVIEDYFGCLNNDKSQDDFLEEKIKSKKIKVPVQFKDLYDDYLFPFRYIENGYYLKYIKSYIDQFGLEHCYFVIFEDLVKDPLHEINKLLDFLSLPNIKSVKKVHGNKTLVSKNKFLLWLRFNSHLVPKFIQKLYCRYNLNKFLFSKPEKLSDIDRKALNKIYIKSVKELSSTLDIDLVQKWDLDSI